MRFKSSCQATHTFIDLTPLVDVIFLMLIFFMVTANILPLKSLNIENPKLSQDSPPLTTQLLIVMDAQNVIYLGTRKEITDLVSIKNQLLAEFATLRKYHPQVTPTTVLTIDRKVSYEMFLRLFAIVQECSPRIRLAYKPQEDPA